MDVQTRKLGCVTTARPMDFRDIGTLIPIRTRFGPDDDDPTPSAESSSAECCPE